MFEIDIVKICEKVFKNRKIFFKYFAIALILCVCLLLVKPVSYQASTTFVPQRQSASFSALSSLSSFAGISLSDISTFGEGVMPMSYPNVVYSPEFLKDFMYKKIPIPDEAETITILDYLTNPKYLTAKEKCYRYSFGYFSYRKEKKYKNDYINASITPTFLRLSEQEQFCANRLRKLIKFEVYEKKPTIEFRVEMNDPVVAAYCSSVGYQLLVDYLTQFAQIKLDKRKVAVDSLFNKAQEDKDRIYLKLANCMDKTQSVNSNVSKNVLEKLQSDYTIATRYYNEIAREKMMLQSENIEKPLLLISPADISNERYKPDYWRIIFLFVFFGALVGSLVAYYSKS